MNGVLNIDKPSGMTSHDVVIRIRRIARIKRVGHAGTLDPDATGVLVVCLGSATRIADLLADGGKRYRCTLVLGAETDTEDASGVVTAEADASHITMGDLAAVLPSFIGEIAQIPPMVSAVHHEGKRLYELARAGVTVERAARTVSIESIDLLDFTAGARASVRLDVACGKGTYIRTLCADIGRALGVGGHMGSLRRTAVGAFRDTDAVPLADLSEESLPDKLTSAADALGGMPSSIVTDTALIDDIGHGRSIPGDAADGDIVRIIDSAGELVALARASEGRLHPYKVFAT